MNPLRSATTSSPSSRPVSTESSQLPRTARPGALASKEKETAQPLFTDGFERQPRSKLVARPTGLRPESVPAALGAPVALGALAPRAQAAPVTVGAEARPNLPVGDFQKVESTLSFDKDVAIDSLRLTVDLPHSYKGDLVAKLTSPSGKTVTVLDRPRDGGSWQGTFPLKGFEGESTRGPWKLTVEDTARGDKGTLRQWSLSATGQDRGPVQPPAPPVPPAPLPPAKGMPVVAVFDGGVDYRHTDLDGAMWTNPNEVAGDGVDNDGNGIADDMHGFNVGLGKGDVMTGSETEHGTHVAGIIAAEDNGQGNTGVAAGKAQVMSVGGIYDGKDLLTNFERAVDYVVDQRRRGVNVRVVNASFGDTYRRPEDQARWNAAAKKLADADILLVAATANGWGSNMNDVADMPANIDLPNVVTVASMDKRNDKLANYSSYGDKVVELAAVGEDVLSTVPGNRWEEQSGTSMATPRVAATAALMFSANPQLTAAQARELLIRTVDVDADLKGKVSTSGKLNLEAAVAAARAAAA